MGLRVRAGLRAVDVPEEHADGLAAILGVDRYRSRVVLSADDARRTLARVREEARRVHAEHAARVGGDDVSWKRVWLEERERGDAWLRLLRDVDDLLAQADPVEVLGD